MKVAVCGNSTCTSKTITAVDSVGNVGVASSIKLSGSGNPVISYHDSTNGDLKVAACGNPTCTTGNIIIAIDSVDDVGWSTSLVLNTNGNPVISYFDATHSDLKLAVCGNPACTSGNTFTTVDSQGGTGMFTSLMLNGSGNPVISYFEQISGSSGALKVATCGNPTCTVGNVIATVDSGSGRMIGEYTSLALKNNGNPIISYYDEINGDLKVAVCGNATCTSGNSLAAVDGAGNVGEYTSTKLRADGRLFVSYFDSTNGDLKMYTDDLVLSPPTSTPTATPIPMRPDTVGVYNNGSWYLRNANTMGNADIAVVFGGDPSDLPVVGDWNGDGMDTIGVYRSSTGFFFLSDSNVAPTVSYSVLFGNPGDNPFAGRWSSDIAHDGVGVYRNSNGILYQKKQLATGFSDFFAVFGNPGDLGVGGDWNGNGFDSIGIYRSSNQTWYLSNNSQPSGITFSDLNFNWAIGTARPVIGDWNGDFSSTVGYFTTTGVFDLHGANAAVGSDNVFVFGPANSYPIAGKWTATSNPPVTGITERNGNTSTTSDDGSTD